MSRPCSTPFVLLLSTLTMLAGCASAGGGNDDSSVSEAAISNPDVPIQFAPGKSSSIEEGTLTADGPRTFTLRASAGQVMALDVESDFDTAEFVEIRGPGDRLLSNFASFNRLWTGVLPSDGTYKVTVKSPRVTTNFRLFATIKTPTKINFAPGATATTTKQTSVVRGEPEYYSIQLAPESRSLSVKVGAFNADFFATARVFASNGMLMTPESKQTQDVRLSNPGELTDWKPGGTWVIEILPTRGNAQFNITATVPPTPSGRTEGG